MFRSLPAVVWMAGIFFVSSIPGPQLPVSPDLSDRWLHFFEYGIFAVLLIYAWSAFVSRLRRRDYLGVGLFGVLYGGIDEWHQSLVPQRQSSVTDVAYDTAGIIAALLIVYALNRKTKN